jgi:hypothetical protein
MKLILSDINMSPHDIDTPDMELAAKWLASWLPVIAESTAKYHYEWRIQIYPTTDSERSWLKEPLERRNMSPHMQPFISPDNCRALANAFMELAEAMDRHVKRIGK